MRITSLGQRDQVLRDLQGNLARLAELQHQVATEKRFDRVEQDPLGAAQLLRAQRDTKAIDQYAKNGTNAQLRLGAEEAVLKQTDELLRQARDFALSFTRGDPPYTAEQTTQRQTAMDQINRLLDSAVSLGNTRIGNEYILAGGQSLTPPFDATPGATLGDYQGDANKRRVEIAQGVLIAPNHTGDEYLAPALLALRELRDAIDPANGQTEAQVDVRIAAVFDASQALQVSRAETATTSNHVAATLANSAAVKNNLVEIQSSIQKIPLEESIASILSLQTTLQASYSATSRLISLSLTDYLR
ncbi:MAG: flagellin N-terminal helical domain-containing protein [Gemmatimonadales bacterium]